MEEGLTVDGGRLRGKLREDGEKRMEDGRKVDGEERDLFDSRRDLIFIVQSFNLGIMEWHKSSSYLRQAS